ncbi:MAG: hypothetical protein JOY53_03350 [Acidobacteriaceae bacterium]|nr:hypothetical protein [Acidobacteriaceae bacterium]
MIIVRLYVTALLFVVSLISQAGQGHKTADPRYAPLWLYQGSWNVSRQGADPKAKPDRLVNECALLGEYFACAQNVNGKPGSLIIFLPAEKSGSYYTQSITTEGRATGRADLEISGDHWTYLSRWPQGDGKITYYRTTNIFTGKDRIHFEQAESPDNAKWTVTGSGDELRVSSRQP